MRCMMAASTCSHQISFLHSEHVELMIFCRSKSRETRISLLLARLQDEEVEESGCAVVARLTPACFDM